MAEQITADPTTTIDRGLRDGYEVHRAALARGMNVTLLPRQVMTVETPQGEQHSFVHGIPQTSTLSGVTYAQDKRMRRALLERAGFTVPRGATFSVGRSASAARKFAARIGYPVVVKPAVGENTIEVMPGLHDPHQLDRAIEFLRTPPTERPNYVRAAYALTELREPDKRRGRVMVPPGYRFLVEQHVPGQYLRFLVLNGTVRGVVLCKRGPWDSQSSDLKDVRHTVHTSLNHIAEEVSRTIPGIPLVAIDIIAPDHTSETPVENAVIVELSERPWLALQDKLNPKLSSGLADEIINSTVGHSNEFSEEVAIAAVIEGVIEPPILLHALTMHCRSLEVSGTAALSDPNSAQITTTMQGKPSTIAWILESLVAGTLSPQRPMLIQYHHVNKQSYTSFNMH